MIPRPWRAAAWYPLGSARLYQGSAAARTEAGLAAFRARWEERGCTVTTWEVLPVPEVEAAAEAAAGSAR